MLFNLKKGLDIPLSGAPEQCVEDAPAVSRVALTAHEYRGLKPAMQVAVGDEVMLGQPLFTHKSYPEIRYVSPASGTVEAVNRGARRVLQSIVIRMEGDRRVNFRTCTVDECAQLSRDETAQQLLAGGLWPAFRTRPYGGTPLPGAVPHSIFVTAMDTRPLAADPQVVIAAAQEYFETGLRAIAHLSEGPVYLCVAGDSSVAAPAGGNGSGSGRFQRVAFDGPHPAGLAGTHVHFLDPVYGDKTVWTIHYQDVIAVGEFFLSGVYPTARVIALGGPAVARPRLLRTRLGASIEELCRGEIAGDGVRVIAGSVLDGDRVEAWSAFVGRFQLQITALAESAERRFLAWIRPGLKLFSVSRVFLPPFLRRGGKFSFSCAQNGSERAIVPIGLYERVFPLELLPTQLLKSLVVMDTDAAQKLGCLELDEEDLALCSYVCPSKQEFGPALRACLDKIEKEG